MTPHFPLFGHPNPYQPILNLAAFNIYPQWLHFPPPPPPYQTHPINLGTMDNIMEHQDML